jgi:hypothetical protein
VGGSGRTFSSRRSSSRDAARGIHICEAGTKRAALKRSLIGNSLSARRSTSFTRAVRLKPNRHSFNPVPRCA